MATARRQAPVWLWPDPRGGRFVVLHGDRKGPPIPIAPLSPLLYTGLAAPTSYSSGEGGRVGSGGPLRSPCRRRNRVGWACLRSPCRWLRSLAHNNIMYPSPLRQFPNFWLHIPCLYANFSVDTHRLFEVRHSLLCSASRMEYIGQVVVQCCLAVAIPLRSTQGKGGFSK